jgi:hypothetical protein
MYENACWRLASCTGWSVVITVSLVLPVESMMDWKIAQQFAALACSIQHGQQHPALLLSRVHEVQHWNECGI